MNIEGNLITTGENVEELQLFNMTPPPLPSPPLPNGP